MKIFYWSVCKFTNLLCRIFYRHKIYGLEHVCSGKAIIAPNHNSFLDPPLIAASWPEIVSFLARKSLFSSPIFGRLMKRLNAYPVSGTVQDISSIKLICQLLKEEHQVVIFPSGIRSLDGSIGPIKAGISMLALRCGAPIIPVYIHGSFQVWGRERRFPRLRGSTACIIGSPIYPEPFSIFKKKEAQEAIGNEVKNSLEALRLWYENGAKGSPP